MQASVSNATCQAAPAAVAVPDELIRAAKQALACMDGLQQHLGRAVCQVEADALRAALAATPVAAPMAKGYDSGIQTGNRVTLIFETQYAATAWFESFSDAYDAENGTRSIALPIPISTTSAVAGVDKSPELQGSMVDKTVNLQGAAAAPVVLPERADWKLVPMATTTDMRIAYQRNRDDGFEAAYRAMLEAAPAAAPVVLPQPVATLHCNDECYVWARASEAGQRMRFEQPIALFTEQQLRALLATATGLPAQAVEMPDFDLRTSKGGRGFVAWYFANVLQRYDYQNYITNKLAADFACDLAKALSSTLAAPQARADARAAELLGFLQDQCIDLRCFTTSDGEDVGWRTVQHHMSEPRERVVSEVYGDQPRRAIREAMARIERDPYCTGPLHLEDDAAIAAAKGE